MASVATLNRSSSNSRTSLLFNDSRNTIEIISNQDSSLHRDLESLTVSNQIPPNSSNNKLKKKSNRIERKSNPAPGSSRCISFSVKTDGCRVCSCEELDASIKAKLIAPMEDCVPRRAVFGVEKTGVECFSYKRNSRKGKRMIIHEIPSSPEPGFSVPDDVLELILVRLPMASLLAARCVCKKWRDLTISPQFVRLRSASPYRTPWLFLFGVTRDGAHTGDIHSLDIANDQWYKIEAERLKGRFLYSVAGTCTDVYIVGGCSIPANSNSTPESTLSLRTHKGVLVFSPLTGSFRRAASMRVARSQPVLGVFEITPGCNLFNNPKSENYDQRNQFARSWQGLGLGAVSDVYGDPHRLSLRRRLRDIFEEDDGISPEFSRERNKTGTVDQPKLALIAVGGHGCWEEPLESGEIYDPLTDRWVEIMGLPPGFGSPCSGTVCDRTFYVYSEADKLAGFNLDMGYWVVFQMGRVPTRLRDYGPKIVSCRDRVFMLCVSWCERDGQVNRREKAVRKVFELDVSLSGNKWREVGRHPDAPMDWCAAYVADRERVYGVEMFRIFGQVLGFVTGYHVEAGGGEMRWARISRKHAAHEADALCCTMKSIALVHL